MSAPAVVSEKTSKNPKNPKELSKPPSQDPQVGAFVLASFFLIVPIGILLVVAARAQPATPVQTVSLLEDYRSAVLLAEQPGIAPVSQSLVSVDTGPTAQPITVVTWARGDAYSGKTNAPESKDTWVTVVPNLKDFCKNFVRVHGADLKQLTHRLEQRLGLPPDSGYDTFVEFTIDPKLPQFFRPCKDPAPGRKTCEPEKGRNASEFASDLKAAEPEKKQEFQNRYWFLNTYYRSFAGKDQYPWTSLGYTFDWARKENGGNFERFGESEFIVAAGAPIKSPTPVDTATYCKP